MKRYQYSSLSKENPEIRLVTLLPMSNKAKGIEINLDIVSMFPGSPSYEALSYTWGSTQNCVPIHVQTKERVVGVPFRPRIRLPVEIGVWTRHTSSAPKRTKVAAHNGYLEVTRNLAEALVHLGYNDKPRVLWIDAICINQQDVPERNAQVQQMSDIYRRARQTIIWLGPERNDSSLGIDTLNHLGSKITVDWETWTCLPEGEKGEDEDSGLADLSKPLPINPKQWDSIVRLLERPWFQRLWIWQEARLAKYAVVVCGSRSMPWDRLRAACFRLDHCIDHDGLPDGPLRDIIGGLCFYVSTYNSHTPLVDNLRLTRHSKCSDPRDKVYALLNISQGNKFDQTRGGRAFMVPDYGKSVQDVYQEFVVRTIEVTRKLSPLMYCDLRAPLPNAPSWVPNIPVSTFDDSLNHLTAASGIAAHASSLGNGILEVSGIIVATIDEVLPTDNPTTGSRDDSLYDLCKRVRRLASRTLPCRKSNIYPCGGSLGEAFCRTIHCDHFAEDYFPSDPSLPPFQDSLDVLLALMKEPEENLEKLHDEASSEYSRYDSDSGTLDHCEEYLQSRNFLITREGYIGLAPSATKPGDQIGILLGCPVPIALRPVDDGCFIVVGPCYLHGFSKGEALFGPYPPGYARVIREGHVSFINRATGEWSLTDPRLGPLPPGWQMISENERTPMFVPPSKGRPSDDDPIYKDPRQTLEAIRARGADLCTIRLK
ncbi:MAG: hypothetical protein Q9170_007629 [Blastenia crenularia]